MVAAKMDELRKQLDQLRRERDALQAENEAMKSEAAAQVEKEEQLRQQMATMKSDLINKHAEEKSALEKKLKEADEASGRWEAENSRLQAKMESLETARELEYYRAMEKERRRWEEREERLLSRLEATPVHRSDHKPDSGSLSAHEKEALIRELTDVKDQLEEALHHQEKLSQQLEVAEQDKVKAEKQIEEQQLRIEELQAELHLADVKAKRVERETLVKPGGESAVEGAEAHKSEPASPIVGTSGGGTIETTPPVEEKPTEASPGDKAAVSMETTASPSKPPPKPPPADATPPAKEDTKADKEEKVGEPPAKDTTAATKADIESAAVPTPVGLGPAYGFPQQQKFSGEDPEGDTFEDWIEQFEMVARLYKWSDEAKLINLITRLRGPAYLFYRACLPEQKENYTVLRQELMKRFTPVQIQAIQSELFHDRKQKEGESVDEYAQDLRRLFRKAYGKAQQGSQDAEKMGRSVLAYQFVAGLCQKLKAKVAGNEGNFEQLLTRARFEEAKFRELASHKSTGTNGGQARKRESERRPAANATTANTISNTTTPARNNPYKNVECHECGRLGHIARFCRYANRGRDREARGRRRDNKSDSHVSAVTEVAAPPPESVSPEIEEALTKKMASMNSVTTDSGERTLGPVPVYEILVNGVPLKALVDTGSPATVISLDRVLDILARDRPQYESLEQWKLATQRRLEPPAMLLKSYCGSKLNLVAQIELQIATMAGSKVEAMVYVQKDAPVDLLLGTDLQPLLGFSLTVKAPSDNSHDLLQSEKTEFAGRTQNEAHQDETALARPTLRKEASPFVPRNATPPTSQCGLTVKLLQASRVPARHQKLIKVEIDQGEGDSLFMFVPRQVELQQHGVVMVDSVMDVEGGRCVNLVIENHSFEPRHLEEGLVLGEAHPIQLMLKETEPGNTTEPEPTASPSDDPYVATLKSVPAHLRKKKLLELLNLKDAQLDSKHIAQLESFLVEWADVFALDNTELGSTDVTHHHIETGDHSPIRQPMRRTPFALRDKIDSMVKEMAEQGVVRPSKSPWSSPVVLVRKKDNTMRFCVDYRKLNSITKMDSFPLPRIDDTLDMLSQSKFFTTLDLASGYWQVEMDPASSEKTAFTTYSGHYEFTKMPFGLCNAPATFQRLMETVLAGLVRNCCVVYLDDILVVGRTVEEHLDNLKKVFERLREAGLRLKPKKCYFLKKEVEYLGHVVSADGVRPDPQKLSAVRNYAPPTDLKSLRAFLGLASYYRKFIPHFSRVASPLHALTRKGVPFDWSAECQEAFQTLKQLLMEAPILAYPDFSRDFLLETDASGAGLGAVLAQRQEDNQVRPVAYASRTLQPHEKNYGISEMEALAVVWAVNHFRPYLYGHHCDVYTDHSALKALLNTPHPSGKLARWGMAIQELDLTIFHRSGKHNSNADALSRAPVPSTSGTSAGLKEPFGIIAAVRVEDSVPQVDLSSLQLQDPDLVEIITYLKTGNLPDDGRRAKELVLSKSQYVFQDNILYRVESDKSLRAIPPKSYREKLFREAHAGTFGAHLGDVKVHSQLSRHYWWDGMRTDISRWCKACIVCATRCPSRPVRVPLTPIPVAGPFDRVGVDIIQFPQSHDGNKYAVVFMDYLTKWPEVFPTANQSAATVANLLVREVVSRHGVPAELLSDRGKTFLSGLMSEVCKLLGVHKANTTAYHPQTDGLVERFNRTLTAMLSKTVEKDGKNWDRQLPYVLFAYRTSRQEATKESPFFLMHGRDPRLPTEAALDYPLEREHVDLGDYGAELAENLSEAWETARSCIKQAQQKQKKNYDRRTSHVPFRVGQRVFVYKPAAKSGPAYKFARPFHGPYRVVELTANNAKVCPVDRPGEEPIFVALDRLRRCSDEIPDAFWPRKTKEGSAAVVDPPKTDKPIEAIDVTPPTERNVRKKPPKEATTTPRELPKNSPWHGRLRARKHAGTPVVEEGEM